MICVDELRQIKNDVSTVPNTTYQGCYLYTDNNKIETLHSFARSMGLSRESFKSDNFLPRYVLDEEKRKQAIFKGANQVLFRKTVEVCRKNKDQSASMIQSKRREREKDEK